MVSAGPVRRPGVRESTHSPLSVESDLRVCGRKPPGSTRMCGSAYTGRWWGRASRSVSRVLCPTPRRWRRPSLSGRRCRRPLAAYPGARAGRPRTLPVWPCSGWGLPSHASHLTCWWSLAPPFHPYRRDRGLAGGLLSVALSRGSPRVAVSNHPALRSPDFPRRVTSRRPTRPPDRLARRCEGTRLSAARGTAGSDDRPTSRRPQPTTLAGCRPGAPLRAAPPLLRRRWS